MRVLVIDNHDSFTFNLTQALESLGLCEFEVAENDAIPFDRLERFDKALISPGPGTPQEAGGLMEFLDRMAGRLGILGVCLGHQAIAVHFGGELVQMPLVCHGIEARVRITDSSESLFEGVATEFAAGLYHSWAVAPDTLPSCLRVTAVSSEGVIMALRHETLDMRGVQFHPESIMTPVGRSILRNWLKPDRTCPV
jgi:anthranilate synthase component 2